MYGFSVDCIITNNDNIINIYKCLMKKKKTKKKQYKIMFGFIKENLYWFSS